VAKSNQRLSEQQIDNVLRGFIIGLILLAPFSFMISLGEEWYYFHIIAVLWDYRSWSDVHGDMQSIAHFMDPLSIASTIPLSSIRLLFAYFVIRNLHGKSSSRSVWILGALSQLMILLFYLPNMLGITANPGIGGPIPILLIAGVVSAHYWGREPVTTPW
jgi:hypothetical protein